MDRYATAKFNYADTGLLCGRFEKESPTMNCNEHSFSVNTSHIPSSYSVKSKSVVVGHGRKAFEKATALLFSGNVTNTLDWIQLIVAPAAPASSTSTATSTNGCIPVGAGTTVATLSRFYRTPLWSMNPCRVLSAVQSRSYKYKSAHRVQEGTVAATAATRVNSDKQHQQSVSEKNTADNTQDELGSALCITTENGLYSEVVYSTLQGHFLTGEEAFRVYTRKAPVLDKSMARRALRSDEDEVVFEVMSYSKGCNRLGDVLVPLIHPLQNKFIRDHCASMQMLMALY